MTRFSFPFLARWSTLPGNLLEDSTLGPRQPLTPAPYANYSYIAGNVTNGAITGAQLASGAVNTSQLAANAVDNSKIAAGQVVKSLNGLRDNVTLRAGSNVVLTAEPNGVVLSANGPGARLDLFATVAGGNSNRAEALHAGVGGGFNNRATAPSSTIGGGSDNVIQANAFHATIGGGNLNTIEPDAIRSSIGGGELNRVRTAATFATVPGGVGNEAGGFASVVVGGSANRAGAPLATVGGGANNVIQTNAAHSTIAGGNANTIGTNAIRSFIGGGELNRIRFNAAFSTVPGGVANEAGGFASLAAGRRAKAVHDGSFVWGDSLDADFASSAPNQFLVRASGGVGIGTSDPAGAALRVAGTVRADAFNGPIAASQLTGTLTAGQLSASAPSSGQVLGYNGTAMVWQTPGDGSNVWSLNGTSAYYNGGNVGIGTTSPRSKLEVAGNTRINGQLNVANDGHLGVTVAIQGNGGENPFVVYDYRGPVLFQLVHAQSYSIDWFTIDDGGGTSTGGVYSVSGTIGQPDAGKMNGGNFTLEGGFWGAYAVQTPGAPRLSIERVGSSVRVFWPLPAPGFVLDETLALASPPVTISWAQVPFPYQTNASSISITVPAPTGNRFFRLRRP